MTAPHTRTPETLCGGLQVAYKIGGFPVKLTVQKTRQPMRLAGFIITAGLGFEPRQNESESKYGNSKR